MWAWGSPVHYEVRAGATSDADTAFEVRYTLANAPVIAETLSVGFVVSGAPRTATAAASGVISGTGVTGRLNPVTGDVELYFATAPDRGTAVSNSYTWRDGDALTEEVLSAPVVVGQVDLSSYAPFRGAGTCKITLENGASGQGILASDGLVYLVQGRYQPSSHLMVTWLSQSVGAYNPATGVVTITNPASLAVKTWQASSTSTTGQQPNTSSTSSWVINPGASSIAALGNLRIEKDTPAFDPQAVTGENILLDAGLTFSLAKTSADRIVPNSLRFALGGQTYEDRNGVLFTDVDPETGSGLVAGSVDYAGGLAHVTYWTDGATPPIVTSCLTVYGSWTAIDAVFRTSQSPIKPEALSVTATTAPADGPGEVVTGAADADGNIVGAKMRGAINHEMGTAWLQFGTLGVDDVWSPLPVQPETIRYNAVAYSYLPLDADILGIDPVRLPSDGRVPIYRAGDVAMVMHTAETAPQSVIDGSTINCGRGRLAWAKVVDADGDVIRTGYQVNRTTGTVVISDTAGMAMPIRVRHTVGDLRQITDAQITGEITLSRPLTHNYPAGESIVSSCLLHGDRRARVSAVWDQATWNGTWLDTIAGSEATATLDVIAHPIEVTNEGSETERWVIRWTSTTNVEVLGQRRGLVYSGPFNADLAPINPRTRASDGSGGVPYFRVPLAANGGGWSAANVVRFNTVGALADIWIARSIQQSDEPEGDGADGVEICVLGNIDRT
jgi:hypothetical protein